MYEESMNTVLVQVGSSISVGFFNDWRSVVKGWKMMNPYKSNHRPQKTMHFVSVIEHPDHLRILRVDA